MTSAGGLWNVSENFGAEILNSLNWVRNKLKGSLTQNCIPTKFKNCPCITQRGIFIQYNSDYYYILFLISFVSDMSSFLISFVSDMSSFLWLIDGTCPVFL
jgi:hypothetical protein